MRIDLPSGRSVEIRKMKVKDEDIILDESLRKKEENMEKLLQSVTGLGEEEILNMLTADRTFISIAFRKISKGNLYYPRISCPFCKSSFEAEIDLDKLVVKNLDRKLVDENNQFMIELPVSKKRLRMKLTTGEDEKKLRKARRENPDKYISYLMMIRTEEIEGEKIKNVNFFKELDIDDSDYLKEEYDRHDCGVETIIECDCAQCSSSFMLDIPFDSNFFLQKRRTVKS